MGRTLVIAEIGSTWEQDLNKARRLITAAKECDADVAKFQWTSNAGLMAMRRGLGADAIAMYDKHLMYPASYLEMLKGICDEVGIEFACTVYLIQDIATIAPLVKRFKVSAFESGWREFLEAHQKHGKPLVVSMNHGGTTYINDEDSLLYCVSEYPTSLDRLHLTCMDIADGYDGLSDHTANVLTGAAAVAAGAKIVEAHIKLESTSESNPDYPHSLEAQNTRRDGWCAFGEYVRNIRTVEKML